ncbi:cobalamin B12-binding domain-containing protein [Desulfotignum phosphitoxidans]|uniref:Cobalamin B12-binding domain-containing protein n=1 Tax=Desulfotignum phosphitoxidans DSM 13687 TaxID=1286635 RepID=S0G4R1_9BACT|nr:cobalamin-dependent protein [Desulfotignum phosphitoxidans]EMS78976.1 cobalamin B12-binding domain-containing protein [Desulfotignum phosphitoxidans DSM 13687]
MITESLYQEYLTLLLEGNRRECARIVQQLLDRDIEIKTLYADLFQKSLYEVGRLWEFNKISVAKEHLVTAISEGLLNLVYPRLFDKTVSDAGNDRKVVISCAANEFHQVGGKMVADIFELNGWDSQFIGANTPVDHMLTHIQDEKPDLVGLSVSVYFNMPALKAGLAAIRGNFQHLDILVGGQAFNWGGTEISRQYSGTTYVPSLDRLTSLIAE